VYVWYIYERDGSRGEGLAKVFQCRHGGVLCDARIEGQTEEEVLSKVVDHARNVHGVDLARAKTLSGYARSLIRDDSRGAPAEG
jgi:predicted small metal-binding protein